MKIKVLSVPERNHCDTFEGVGAGWVLWQCRARGKGINVEKLPHWHLWSHLIPSDLAEQVAVSLL